VTNTVVGTLRPAAHPRRSLLVTPTVSWSLMVAAPFRLAGPPPDRAPHGLILTTFHEVAGQA